MSQQILESLFLIILTFVEALANESIRITRNEEYLNVLSECINELNVQVHAELLLCVNLNATESNENLNWLLQQSSNVSKLIVNQDIQDTDYEVLQKFKSNVVTLAYVTEENMFEVQRKITKLLWRLHFKDVIYVFDPKREDTNRVERVLHKLFTECWRNGFTHVMAFYGAGYMYTYHPFPQIHVKLLPNISAYRIKTHLENFQGHKLRSPISNSSPRSYHYIDQNGNVATGGYFYKIVRTFIEHHNGTFEELVMPTYNLNFTDYLRAFKLRQIDIVANLLYMNDSYSHSHVLENFNVYIMAPFAKPIPEYLYIVKPFTSALWILLLVTVIYVVPIIAWIYRRQRNMLDFSETFLEVLKTILFLPHNRRRMESRAQISVFVLLLLTGFLLTNFYLAKLSSLLATKVYGDQINTFDDIANTKLLLPQTDIDLRYLHAVSRIHPSVLDHIWLTSAKVVHNLRRDLNTSYLHSGVVDKIDFFLYQQKFLKVPYFRKINQILYVLPVFIPMPHGSPFLVLLNRYLRRIADTGIIKKIQHDNEEDGILSGEIRFFYADAPDDHTLTLEYLSLAFLVWGIGLTSATICFVYEKFKERFTTL